MSISTENAVIARLISHGKKFEILVDPYKAMEAKRGKDVPIDDLTVIDEVFEDSAKGERCKEEDLKKVFGTDDFKTIAYRIIREGMVQLTTEQRRKIREEKKIKIANIISRKSVDPKTKIPHPPQRILNAMDEARVHIDETESAEAQVERVLTALKPVIPISMESVKIAIRIPAAFVGKSYGKIKEFGEIKKEEWKNDGSWFCVIEIPAGMQGDFYELLNSLTKGEAETKIIK
ncbi:MAG: ribosome assembly factor SBDS [Candidatus Aenigmarchaeota archaeon]|nr:ribosome assembly factor SBDS [Candidatus Aenigmarchaeota archaeon]